MEHGVKRVRLERRSAESLEKERRKITDYTAATSAMVSQMQQNDRSQAALDLTTRVLELNPEFPTAWNYRRKILRDGLLGGLSEQEAQAILHHDLQLTSLALRRNPKTYSVWEHRKWVLRVMPDPDWGFELKMVEKLLDQDARNMHGWDYRRHVVAGCASSGSPPEWSAVKRPRITVESELAYTQAKISSNFSNFSAWHYRSKLFRRLTSEQQVARIENELELVRHALWTDPNDQSAWLYHCWLIADGRDLERLQREVASIEELAEMEPDSRWCLESLNRYKALMLHHDLSASSFDRVALQQACRDACHRLQALDPPRQKRYDYLEHCIPAP